jgi:hypothetical protein
MGSIVSVTVGSSPPGEARCPDMWGKPKHQLIQDFGQLPLHLEQRILTIGVVSRCLREPRRGGTRRGHGGPPQEGV